jgi:tetratricopeptide (TPR) repeat protein
MAMKKAILISLFLIGASLMQGCSVPFDAGLMNAFVKQPVNQDARIDEIPMYGGIDRSKVPKLKAGDEKFISDVTAHFGSREKASVVWINQGYRFYRQDQIGMAMRRFNQAWLLNPNNPDVYAGFAAVLHDQKKSCDAMKMMEKALALDPPTFHGIYPDAARIVTLCAISDKTLSPSAKAELIARS